MEMPAIWHLETNTYLWHTYLDHREGVYWERHTSGHTELFCLVWVQQIFLALYVWCGSSVYEGDPEWDIGWVTRSRQGCTNIQRMHDTENLDNQPHFVIIELCQRLSFLSVAMIKHSDQRQLSGGQGLFGLYFQGIVYFWEESAGTLSRNHVYSFTHY